MTKKASLKNFMDNTRARLGSLRLCACLRNGDATERLLLQLKKSEALLMNGCRT